MAPTDEKLCLQSNDFRENVSSAFGDLRQDKEFTDVTLVCEDGQQVEAHKVVHVASSPFFLNILKRNKNPHPLIYMTDVKSNNLMAMVDFMYQRGANVFQEDFDSFFQFCWSASAERPQRYQNRKGGSNGGNWVQIHKVQSRVKAKGRNYGCLSWKWNVIITKWISTCSQWPDNKHYWRCRFGSTSEVKDGDVNQ